MAQMRTKAERQRILKKCLEIENEGGNVLDYLATENYMSPAATWFNMQREMLHREHPKSGKPRAKGESAQEREDRLQRERCQKIVEAAEAGKSIRNALHDMGWRNPRCQGQKYRFLREFAKEWAPELYEKMPEKLPAPGKNAKREEKKMKKAEKPIEEAVREVFEEAGLVVESVESVPAEEMDPATRADYEEYFREHAGEAVKDPFPNDQIKVRVLELETDMGRYRLDDEGNVRFCQKGNTLNLKLEPKEWHRLMAEVREVLRILEVETWTR